jgi:hypothetical protein
MPGARFEATFSSVLPALRDGAPILAATSAAAQSSATDIARDGRT